MPDFLSVRDAHQMGDILGTGDFSTRVGACLTLNRRALFAVAQCVRA
jgi:hypothetical protein